MGEPGATKSREVFISYNDEDRNSISKIAAGLTDKANLRPWFDKWEMTPAESPEQRLEHGLSSCRTFAVFIGKNAVSRRQESEIRAALERNETDESFRIIIVLLPEAPKPPQLPESLAHLPPVELTRLDGDALHLLEDAIRGDSYQQGTSGSRAGQQTVQARADGSSDVGQIDFNVAAAEKKTHVFISYRHQEPDSSLAEVFADALKQAGHRIFIDKEIRWGAPWVNEIRKGIEKSDYLLLLLSREAAASGMVVEEVLIAKEISEQREGFPVILPVRIRLPFEESLPYELSAHLRTVQQERWDGPDDTSRLVTQLLNTIEDRIGWEAEAPPPAPSVGKGQVAPQPSFDPRNLIIPGGALDIDSRFYITREADEDALNAVLQSRALVAVRAPQQTGKTSLIIRVAHAARKSAESNLRTAFIDFQFLSQEDLQSLDAIWCMIADEVACQLQIEDWDSPCWNTNTRYDREFHRFLDKFVFDEDESPLLLCLDEVNTVFKWPIRSSFFSSVRAFYNSGATDPAMKRVRWLLSTNSEPSFFIEDLNQSPFNIGLQVKLDNFTSKEVDEFAHRHGLDLAPELLQRIMDYSGGRPYLVHRLLFEFAKNPESYDEFLDTSTAATGAFRDHLHRYLIQFQKEPKLTTAMKKVLSGRGCKDARMANRLEAAGLVCRDESGKIAPLCRLYADFFKEALE